MHINAGSSETREALSQYIPRPTLSLKKIRIEENGEATVVYQTSNNDFSNWARLITQVYAIDPLNSSRYGSPMRILAVITEPKDVRKILRNLVKVCRSFPGLNPKSLYSPICLPNCPGGSAGALNVPCFSQRPYFSF